MKPFLILQLRPEDEAADNEFESFLQAGGLTAVQVHRIRMERQKMPNIDLDNYSGVIVGGGPYCVSDTNKPPEQLRFETELGVLLEQVVANDFPYLGACYGLGILAQHLGGTVSKDKYNEPVGAVTISMSAEASSDQLLRNVAPEFRAFAGHKEACQDIPEGTVVLAGSESCPVQIIRVKKNIYATQFHAELDSKGLALRIRVYRHAGYFRSEEADRLIALALEETVTEPEKIFKNFIDIYKKV